MTSGGLDDLVRPQAARTDADPLDAAADDRADQLKIGLESPCAHVMRMADLASDYRSLAADFTTFSHHLTFLDC